MAAAAAGTRQQIAFYGSTPAYRPVLDVHGWGGLQDELNGLSKQGEWVRMGELIDDEILNTFAVVGPPEAIAPELHRRYGDVVDRVLVLRPVPQRSRPLDPGARRHQSCLAPDRRSGRDLRQCLGRISPRRIRGDTYPGPPRVDEPSARPPIGAFNGERCRRGSAAPRSQALTLAPRASSAYPPSWSTTSGRPSAATAPPQRAKPSVVRARSHIGSST